MLEDKISVLKLLGLPETFTIVLLTFSFILLLAPYFSGADFGLFKIPEFTDSARKKLKIIGPVIFLTLVILFVPMIPARVPVATGGSNSNNNGDKQNNSNSPQVNNGSEPTPSVDSHYQAQQYLRRAHELNNRAEFKEALAECEKVLDLEPENQEALTLRKQLVNSIAIGEKYRKD